MSALLTFISYFKFGSVLCFAECGRSVCFVFDCYSFFPSRISPFVAVVANIVFAVLVRLRVCQLPQRKYDIGAPTTITVSLPGASLQEVERRRLLLCCFL